MLVDEVLCDKLITVSGEIGLLVLPLLSPDKDRDVCGAVFRDRLLFSLPIMDRIIAFESIDGGGEDGLW